MDNAYATFASTAESTPNLEYTYDFYGHRKTVKRGGVSHATYAYDGLVLNSETLNQDTLSKTLTRNYDGILRPLSLEVSGDYTTGYGYDTTGRLKYVWDHPALDSAGVPVDGVNDPLADRQFTYNYKGGSYNLLQTVAGPAHTVTNTWEDHRNVLLAKNNHPHDPTDPISLFNYDIPDTANSNEPSGLGANSIGQRESLVASGSAFTANPALTWGYDSLGQVISAANGTTPAHSRAYAYDTIGNRIEARNGMAAVTGTANYTANPLNQYTATPYSTNSPVHDPDGNLTEDRGANKGSQERQYVWDAENRLIAVNKVVTRDSNDVITDTTLLVSYQYDHLSRLIVRSTTADAIPEGAATTHYLYDGSGGTASPNMLDRHSKRPTLGAWTFPAACRARAESADFSLFPSTRGPLAQCPWIPSHPTTPPSTATGM